MLIKTIVLLVSRVERNRADAGRVDAVWFRFVERLQKQPVTIHHENVLEVVVHKEHVARELVDRHPFRCRRKT